MKPMIVSVMVPSDRRDHADALVPAHRACRTRNGSASAGEHMFEGHLHPGESARTQEIGVLARMLGHSHLTSCPPRRPSVKDNDGAEAGFLATRCG